MKSLTVKEQCKGYLVSAVLICYHLWGGGALWAQQFYNFNQENSPLPSDNATCLRTDKTGNLWIGTNNGLARISPDGEWMQFKRKGTADSLLTRISAMDIDPTDGTVWIGAFTGNVVLVQLSTQGEYLGHYEVPYFQNKRMFVNSIAIDREGRKWIATEEGGVWMIDRAKKWFSYDVSTVNHLPSNTIRAIAVDENDTKWVGTDAGLISTKDGRNWTLYDIYDEVTAITTDGKSSVCISVQDRKKRQQLYCNNLLFKNTGKQSRNKFFRIQDIVIDSTGAVWAAGTGLARYVKEDKDSYDWDNSGLNTNSATAIVFGRYQHETVLWISSSDMGLFCMSFPKPEPPVVAAKMELPEVKEVKPEPLVADNSSVPIAEEPPTPPIDTKQPEPEPEPEPVLIIQEKKVRKGETIQLDNVNFAKANFRLSDYRGVEALLRFMRENPTVQIEISGHTDINPPQNSPDYGRVKAYHQDLSEKRVNTVFNYLTSRGIESDRIVTKAYGGEQPLVNESSDKNMRVEFKILNIK
jgi:outer membrane protein OmpA-like peptidoglycan-associated protein